jgi:catechol 2,3-dioxygenase-like lactoylglutathione lyase family enzyme
MFKETRAFSGFSVDDLGAAKEFYSEKLGLEVAEENGMLRLTIAGSNRIVVYPKPDHVPATFTILNFPVADIDAAVVQLRSVGVEFEMYEVVDDNGVMRGYGPPIAWFTDPAGNILSIIEAD